MGSETSVPISDHVPEQMYAVESRSAEMPAIADAVSWHAGAMSSVSRKCRERRQGALQKTELRAGRNNARGGFDGQTEQGEDVRCPVAGREIDQAGVGGVGVFGNARSAEPMQNKLGQTKPGRVLLALCIGKKLVERVDAEGLRTGAAKRFFGRKKGVGLVFCGDGALVAIAEWIVQRMSVGIEANVVHGPAINGDGGYTFRGFSRGFAQGFFDAGKDTVEWPMERVAARDRAIGKAVDFGDFGPVIDPAKERDAATFGAEVDGNACAAVIDERRQAGVHRRNASAKPPSTGKMWPVVQWALGPARKRMASAQSAGSMAWWVSVRWA